MNDKLDNILAGEPELVPTSGFLASVMDRVTEEAAVPPPIPFPWKRAIPGIILAFGVLCWAAFELARCLIRATPQISLRQIPIPTHLPSQTDPGLWIAVACGVSLASWLLARRIAGRSGLI